MNNALQASLQEQLQTVFLRAFSNGQLFPWMTMATELLPPIGGTEAGPVTATLEETPTGEVAMLASRELQLTVDSQFGIRLYHRGQQLTTDLSNIPRDYPWFQPDPFDPEDVAGYATRHVGRGIRGESPWPEDQWPQVGGVRQGEQNWPPRIAAFGPYPIRLISEGTARAVALGEPLTAVPAAPNAFGVIPRAVFAITPAGGIQLVLHHQNRSELGLSWAPWFVLGFAVPSGGTFHHPVTVFAFPDSVASDPLTVPMQKVWNYAEFDGRRLALINPHVKTLNEPFKKFYRDTNWSVIAHRGADGMVLIRSLLRHDEQFFPFLEHGRYFIEAEHTGPLVPPGAASTVMVQIDWVPLSELLDNRLAAFPQQDTAAGTFEQTVREGLRAFVRLERQGNLVSPYAG